MLNLSILLEDSARTFRVSRRAVAERYASAGEAPVLDQLCACSPHARPDCLCFHLPEYSEHDGERPSLWAGHVDRILNRDESSTAPL